MDNEKTLPKRKELRIKQHDYSSTGAYFVTICVKDRKPILSTLIQPVGVGALCTVQYDYIQVVQEDSIQFCSIIKAEK